MNTVVLVGLFALVVVAVVMIVAIGATIWESTSRRRANELYWYLEDLLAAERDGSDDVLGRR